jgi:RNA polymerase primary sigma factor
MTEARPDEDEAMPPHPETTEARDQSSVAEAAGLAAIAATTNIEPTADQPTPAASSQSRSQPNTGKKKSIQSGSVPDRGANRSSDADDIRQYLKEIARIPLLTAEEEIDLAQIIEKGREAQARIDAGEKARELQRAARAAADAKDRFIRANLRLVVSVAKKYQGLGLELLDLIQEGNLGLEHAVDKFDWKKGFKFSTYATWWIRQAVTCGLYNKGSAIRLPSERAQELSAARAEAAKRGYSIEDSGNKEMVRLHRLTTPVSLDDQRDEGDSLLDTLAASGLPTPEDLLTIAADIQELQQLLDALNPADREVLKLKFGFDRGHGRSHREMGEVLGLTEQGARKRVDRILGDLRETAGLSRKKAPKQPY